MSKYEEKMSPKELVEFFSKDALGSLLIVLFEILISFACVSFTLALYYLIIPYYTPVNEAYITLTEKERFLFFYLVSSHVLFLAFLIFSYLRVFLLDYFKLFDKKIQEK